MCGQEGGIGSSSTISQLIDAQNDANEKIRRLKAKNDILESKLNQASKELGSSNAQGEEVACLKSENIELRNQVENLKDQLINDQSAANARIDSLLKSLAP